MSLKNNDKYGRLRGHTTAFRMSNEEINYLNKLVQISGMKKQDYMIAKSLNQDVIIQGNPKTFRGLKRYIIELNDTLNRYIDEGIPLGNDETLELLLYISEVLSGLNEDYDVKTSYQSKQ